MSKTPATSRLFHVSPAQFRAPIAEEGLKAPEGERQVNWPSAGESDGRSVYLLADLEEARDWAEYMYMRFFRRGWDHYDIWEVSASGLELERDPNMLEGYSSLRCPCAIARERLHLQESLRFDELGLPANVPVTVTLT